MRFLYLLGLSLVAYFVALGVVVWVLRDRVDPNAELIRHGKAVFAAKCASCHGSMSQTFAMGLNSGASGQAMPRFDPMVHTWRLSGNMLIGISRSDPEREVPAGMTSPSLDRDKLLNWSEIQAILAYVNLVQPGQNRRFQMFAPPS